MCVHPLNIFSSLERGHMVGTDSSYNIFWQGLSVHHWETNRSLKAQIQSPTQDCTESQWQNKELHEGILSPGLKS